MPDVTVFSYSVWLLTIALYAYLVGILIVRRRLTNWAWLFAFACISFVNAAGCLVLFELHRPAEYFWSYWIFRSILSICELGLIVQVFGSVWPANKQWRAAFFWGIYVVGFGTLCVSAYLSSRLPNPLYWRVTLAVTAIDRWLSLAACMAFVICALLIDGAGIKWQKESLLVGAGLAIQGAAFATFSLAITLHTFTQRSIAIPSELRDVAEIISIVIWISAFQLRAIQATRPGLSSETLSKLIAQTKNAVADR